MKKAVLWLILSLAISAVAQAPQQKPIAAMGWFVGGTWSAEASKDVTIKTQYVWADNNAFVRFKTHFLTPKGEARRYDGQFYYDPEKKQITMWYMDAENNIYSGPVNVNGDTTTFDFRGENFEGKLSDLRVNLVKKSADGYHWQLLEMSGGSWKEMAGLDFKRSAEN